MLQDIRQLSLQSLAQRLNHEGELESWYKDVRERNAQQLLPLFVEAPDLDGNFYSPTISRWAIPMATRTKIARESCQAARTT